MALVELPPQAAFDRLLHLHVRDGQVAYQAFQQEAGAVGAYLDLLQHAQPDTFPNRAAQLAFWINAYNAIVIQAVLAHHMPENTRAIPGFFNRDRYAVACEQLTIDQIERRARAFHDYRAHFALTCASRGAPWLRAELYEPGRLSAQLDEQGRLFVGNPEQGCRIDADRGELWLSKIFHWSSPDLINSRLPNVLVAPFLRRQILEAVTPYLPESILSIIPGRPWRLRYLPYDWRLNTSDQNHDASVRPKA